MDHRERHISETGEHQILMKISHTVF
jgi:hypothetical protein